MVTKTLSDHLPRDDFASLSLEQKLERVKVMQVEFDR